MSTLPEIPCASDLVTLRDHVVEDCSNAAKNVTEEPTAGAWVKLRDILLVRLLIFNKRHVSEITELTVKAYQNRPQCPGGNTEIEAGMSTTEQKFAKR